jgi:hypothetical protein
MPSSVQHGVVWVEGGEELCWAIVQNWRGQRADLQRTMEYHDLRVPI